MIVGLTGGIGSGKTTVARLFADLGVPVYDSDSEAKKLMNSSKKIRKAIKALFGKEAYKKKKLNRSFVATQVFDDKKLLKKTQFHCPSRRAETFQIMGQRTKYLLRYSRGCDYIRAGESRFL